MRDYEGSKLKINSHPGFVVDAVAGLGNGFAVRFHVALGNVNISQSETRERLACWK
jgi:hypothetical protein